MNRPDLITLHGRITADPEIRGFPAKRVGRGLELRTFPLTIDTTDEDGQQHTRSILCEDWKCLSDRTLRGDRVDLVGHFYTRSHDEGDDIKHVTNFIVELLSVKP